MDRTPSTPGIYRSCRYDLKYKTQRNRAFSGLPPLPAAVLLCSYDNLLLLCARIGGGGSGAKAVGQVAKAASPWSLMAQGIAAGSMGFVLGNVLGLPVQKVCVYHQSTRLMPKILFRIGFGVILVSCVFSRSDYAARPRIQHGKASISVDSIKGLYSRLH